MAPSSVRVPQIDLATILTETNPYIDLRTQAFDISSRNFLKAVSDYKTREIATLVDRRTRHASEVKRTVEKIGHVEAETKEYKIEELKLAADLQREQEERKEAELSVADYRRQLATLEDKCAAIEAQIEQYRAIKENLERIKKNENDNLLASAAGVSSQTLQVEERLGCVVEGCGNDQLVIHMLRIDPDNPDREFSLDLDLSTDLYQAKATPSLPPLNALLSQLRKSGDLVAFIRNIRLAFSELVQALWMHALHQEILPPSGVQFAVTLRLTPSPLQSTSTRHTLCNLVVARSNFLRIFNVVEEEIEKDDGEDVDMDGQAKPRSTMTRIYFVREHSLHGIVTGMEAIQIMASNEDKLDRLLISFKDAKIALMEWSEIVHDLITVSIHTYERAPQLISMDSSAFQAQLRVDPGSRCAALLLPKDAIAILPFYQTQADLEGLDDQARDMPYAPSYILELPSGVEENMRNVIDFVFLPGFNNPTMAVLYQTQQTWTGRLKEFKDTTKLTIFTMDVVGQHYPIITSVSGLPHDCIHLVPCPASVGGVVILTSNALIYVDQSSRRIGLAMNGWAGRISELSMLPLSSEEQSRDITLEGARLVFADEKILFLILKNGMIHPIEIVSAGKTVSKLVFASSLGQSTIPDAVRKLPNGLVFVGSTAGPSVLLKFLQMEEEFEEPAQEDDVPMHTFDDDEDIYGPVKKDNKLTNGHSATKKTRIIHQLVLCDTLDTYASIADMTFAVAWNGDRAVPELVAATGSGVVGGFTLFQRDLPVVVKRKLHALGGTRGIWSLPIRAITKSAGDNGDPQSQNDTLLISTDATPTPGLSRLAHRGPKGDITISVRIPGLTIGVGSFFQRSAILHVTTNSIRVLEPDGTERQNIQDKDGSMPRAKIRSCSISDPYVIVIREDDSIGMFIDTDRGKIRRKDMSPMGDKSSRYLTGCFFTDTTGLFDSCFESAMPPNSAVSVDKGVLPKSKWLLLVRPSGVVEIWTLPKLTLAFSTPGLASLQNVVTDSHQPPTPSPPEDPPRKPQDLDIEQVTIAPLGESHPKPHLFIFLRCGHLAAYQIVPDGTAEEPPTITRSSTLNLKFVKVLARSFEIQRPDENDKSIIAEQKRISRQFVPFVTGRSKGTTLSGVFFTGDKPNWILATDKGSVKMHSSGHAVVYSFTQCTLWDSTTDFLVYSDEGPSLLEWIPDINLDTALPSKSIPRGRSYSHVAFDSSTSLIVAASSLSSKFTSFDEDNVRIWESDAPNITDPLGECSCLELISPDLWISMDGFEFATNEFITALAIVNLETSSTESGNKEFIAVGTTINRGEDLAAKGTTYIFEIVEVVPDPTLAPKRWYKLRLRFKDDVKGPVTALCGFNGYLVSSMGQKIFVRAFDDDRLVGVAFLDVGVYVTSLQTMKNLLLIGDAVKSVMFVAFQEDPYKLVILARDLARVCVTRGDFFFAEGEASMLTCDEEGVIRMYEYNPHDPNSRDGRHLLLRTEFHGQCEYRASLTIARRVKEEPIPQAKLICGSTDGSLKCLTPVDDATAKRLQLLQGQLTRNMQHFAGLNPKAFRIVRNDFVSKPLSKGILDGNLLAQYEALPLPRQVEMTNPIGTKREEVLRDWMSLVGPW
ncbi:Cleavage and polyadenylation specific protein [Mycena indigotica]|uniref:Cleavage and polyadenylation specific protein n=1 Tax=Mycena indigotica TaxID=2126181 RepID=A0A8H6VT29_9AGAR|nr:Cleavage and polyadenylation specific protein [Mycena indigotica]KAF7292889.1 Cleavage and polyadenylation specific protein [Mycena indigotica]